MLGNAEIALAPNHAGLGWVLVVVGDAAAYQCDQPPDIDEEHHCDDGGKGKVDRLSCRRDKEALKDRTHQLPYDGRDEAADKCRAKLNSCVRQETVGEGEGE